MVKIEFNAIFYSINNQKLAYDVKKACFEIGATVINVTNFTDLVTYLQDIDINIVIFDYTTIEYSENVIEFLKTYRGCSKITIIFILDSYFENLTSLKNNGYIFHLNDSFINQLKKIENSIKSKAFENNEIKFDILEVNSYLTTYLLNLGFLPKHAGFNYIKQAIELALKNNGNLGSLSREVYPTIASKNKTLTQNIERNIRNAIECACNSNTGNFKEDYVRSLLNNGKISNRIFLCYLLDKVLNSVGFKNATEN